MVHTNLTENLPIIYCTLIPPPTIYRKLLSSYKHQQPKDFPKIYQVQKSLTKVEYENALENSEYHSINLNYTQITENHRKRNRSRNIIWFNPPHSQNVITNVAKRFLNLLDHYFPKSNKLLNC